MKQWLLEKFYAVVGWLAVSITDALYQPIVLDLEDEE